jgi:hypothetical protein
VDVSKVPVAVIAAIRLTGVTECLVGAGGSLWFDVGRSDHRAPFVGLGGDMPAEIGG